MIAELHGKYARHRAKLDYSYHMNYTEARQQWQDGIVERVVSQMPPQKRPWLVFTCGPTGAGKGYVMSWLSKCGIFPLENVVHIDSDRFKRAIPEWDVYMRSEGREQVGSSGRSCLRRSCACSCACCGSDAHRVRMSLSGAHQGRICMM